MGPINYLAMVPEQDFLKDLQGGLATGQIFQQRAIQNEQRQMAIDQAKQYKLDLQSAMASPTPQNFASLALKYPQQREAVKQAWDGLSEGERKAEGDTMAQAYSALLAGKPEMAKQVVQNQIDARKNSGLDTSHYDSALTMLDGDPQKALGSLGFALSHINDPKTFATQFSSLRGNERADQLQPDAVRKGAADASEAEADATLKKLGITGQTLGALQGKNAKPAQAKAAITSLVARGVISKDEKQVWLDAVPSDPKQLDAWLGTMRATGMKPDDQMKYTTPDANTVANNATSRANTRDNNATQLAVQDRIAARMEAKGDAEPTLPPEALTMMAQQYLAGDKSVMQNLGRGAQGAANIVALRAAITKEAGAKGMTGPQIAATMADYAGQMAGMRTSGTISARIENAAAEAAELIPIARTASAQVARSGLLPFGKAQIMFNNQTNDPAMAEFATANMGLATAYAGVMARGGKTTVSDMEHAREILLTAKDHKSYLATISMMEREIKAAQRAPNVVREHLRDQIGSQGGGHGSQAGKGGAPKVVNFGDLK